MYGVVRFVHAGRGIGFSPRRVTAVAVVLSLHVGWLMALLTPAMVRPRHPARTRAAVSDALRVRWLPPASATPPPAAARPVPGAHAAASHRPVAGIRTAPPATGTASASPGEPVVATAPPDAAATDYIPGNGRLAGPAWRGSRPRLPGSGEPVRGAPVIAMVDPRTQGAAGLVRFIGSLTGAVDPHCVDVEAWRGMTARERIAHHVDPDTIADTAVRYRCGAPPPSPGSAVYWRDRR